MIEVSICVILNETDLRRSWVQCCIPWQQVHVMEVVSSAVIWRLYTHDIENT